MTTAPSTTPQLDLMKHHAQASSRRLYRPATPEEVKKFEAPTEAILLFFAALNIAISDVRDELDAAGLYRHDVKRNLNTAEALIFRTYSALYRKFQTVEKTLTRKAYDYWMIEVSNAIDDCILLTPPRRSYNIAVALARLIADLNDSMGRFVVPEALPMHHVVKYLERIKCVEDHHIDFIIARKLRDMMDEDERRRKAEKAKQKK